MIRIEFSLVVKIYNLSFVKNTREMAAQDIHKQ